jgi:hypothetical protein
MAQMDAKVNIEVAQGMRAIAMESKRDSSAMKTIAILGMFFLPGTFVAVSLTPYYGLSCRAERIMPLLMLTDTIWYAIFAMPVFNWDNDNALVVKQGFKYYCALALPLTFLVFVGWLLPWRVWLSKARSSSSQPEIGIELTHINP